METYHHLTFIVHKIQVCCKIALPCPNTWLLRLNHRWTTRQVTLTICNHNTPNINISQYNTKRTSLILHFQHNMFNLSQYLSSCILIKSLRTILTQLCIAFVSIFIFIFKKFIYTKIHFTSTSQWRQNSKLLSLCLPNHEHHPRLKKSTKFSYIDGV